ncbi:DUF11 domain-containing protein [Streptomyces sp. NBC_01620]|nr:DUF11 domain-containing protein [Streptomyces sp. NBC_01620]
MRRSRRPSSGRERGSKARSAVDGTTATVTDTLPTGLTAASLSGTGWTCTLATLTCTRSNTLAPGGSYPPITLTVKASCTTPKHVTNTATITGGGDSTTARIQAGEQAHHEPRTPSRPSARRQRHGPAQFGPAVSHCEFPGDVDTGAEDRGLDRRGKYRLLLLRTGVGQR